MKVKCKVLGLGYQFPASDGSVIPVESINMYLESDSYKEAIRQKTMLSSLTHRSRNLSSVFPDKPALSKTIGKDDAMLIVSPEAPTPTHYVEKLYVGDDNWLWADLVILDENLFDDVAKQNILRLKGLLRSGIRVHTSAVVIAYWNSQKDGKDIATKIVEIRGIDITLNSSWKDSHIEEIIEDEKVEKEFSEKESEVARVKCFSDLSEFGTESPRTSKINNQFNVLRAKAFSYNVLVGEVILDKEPKQKEFTVASVNDQIRMTKLSPRIRFRRIILEYRQVLKQHGGIEKIDEETLRIMKSLFANEILKLLQEATPQVMKGKQLNALLGAASLSAEVRKACNSLNLPLRLALMENKKQGFVSKARYQKIQDAYNDFVHSILAYVFETPTTKKLQEEELNPEEGNEGKN